MKQILFLISFLLFSYPYSNVYSADMSTIKGLSCSYVRDHHFIIKSDETMNEMVRGSGVKKSEMTLMITDIDLSKRTAKMVGSNDTVSVVVIRNGMGLTFLEITDIAVHTYVVYNTKTKEMKERDFPTIQSRNGLIFGTGISSQLAGMCVAVFRNP